MRKKFVFILAALLVVTIIISRRDRYKDERAALLNQITVIEADLAQLNERRTQASKAMEMLSSEVKQYTDSVQQHSQRRTKLQDELDLFILDHKMATVAVMATAGGVASVIDGNIDEETKNALRFVGFIGALYCIGNSEECADVTARILYFGSQIESENKNISDATSKLAARKLSLQERGKEYASLGDMMTKKTSERDTLKQKHDSLLCRLCF
jgi:septal ring factor EnvC (AmiA/AmiB activator)